MYAQAEGDQRAGIATVYNRYDYRAEMRDAIDAYNDYLLKLLES